MRNRSRALTALGSLAAGILVACATSDTNGPNCDAIAAALVSRIEVQPATATVNLGQSLQMEALAFSCAGPLGAISVFQWRSGDPTVATVSPTGMVVAMTTGQVAIYAAVQGKEESASITTHPVRVAASTVEPPAATVGVGRTSRLTARAFDAEGHEITGRPVTWASGAPGIVSVSAQGDITGVTAGGPVDVTATIEGASAASHVTVALVPVNSVVVAPATSTIAAAATLQLTATLRDELGNVLNGRAVNWTSSNPAIASVAGAGGLVTGLAPGLVTITANSEGRSGAAQVTVTLGAAAKLAFVQQPSMVQAGAAMTPAVTVAIQDAAGNRITTATTAVTVALAAPGAGSLGGTTTVNAVNGLATFSDLTVSPEGIQSLTAGAAGLTGATSASFVVTARPATRLAYVQQPLSAVAGSSLGTVTVELQDATGGRPKGQPAGITLAIGTNPGGGTLSGTLTEATVNGLATFTGLAIDRSGTGYTLTASATGLTGATSDAFNITPGVASRVGFIVQPCPTGCVVALALQPAPLVAVTDGLGNTVTSSTATIAVKLLGGGAATSLGGTISVKAVNGVATFADLTVSAPGTGLTLRAESAQLTPGTSAAFSITSGPRLFFSAQPPPSLAAGAVLASVQVQLQDAQGGRLATAGVPVMVALGPSGTLNGTRTRVTDANGVATFDDLSVAASVGTTYALSATATGYQTAVSQHFAVTAGAPSQLTFTQQPPASVTVGAPVSPEVLVQLRDVGDNAVSLPGTTIGLTVSGGGTLTSGSAITSPSGLATFTGLTVTATPGAAYTLTAASTGLASATSNSFTVAAALVPTQLGFLVQPGNDTRAGSPVSPVVIVEVRDANGGRVTTSTAIVTLLLGPNPTGAALTGNVVTAVGGVAQFPALQVSRKGKDYTLVATSPGLASATSVKFQVR
jgi:uncharacterized protein YjdB